jgi:single-strand DNA-binding protein
MNVAIILGRLTRDPAIKTSQSGMTIARFTLAVNRLNKKGQNPEADFINCVAFGKTADAIGNYVYKGQRLLVEGRIQTGSYTSKSGEKKFTTEISVNRAEFIEKRSESSTQGNSHAGNHNASPVGFEQMGTEVNDPQWMEQEDLPF